MVPTTQRSHDPPPGKRRALTAGVGRLAALLFWVVTAVLCADRIAAQDQAQAQPQAEGRAEPEPTMPAIVVNGERAGPRLWEVSSETAQIWILGTVSPLPVGMTWRARAVEQALDDAQLLLVAKPLEISLPRVLWMLVAQRDRLMIPGGRDLKDVLSPDLYLRYSTQRSRYGTSSDHGERYRPIIAAALLADVAMKKPGSMDCVQS